MFSFFRPLFKAKSIGIATSIVGIGVGAYFLFRKHIHAYLTKEGTTVAQNIVQSDEIKQSVKTIIENKELNHSLSQTIKHHLEEITKDEQMNIMITELLKQQLNTIISDTVLQKIINDALIEHFENIINNKNLMELVNNMLKQHLQKILDDEEISESFTTIIKGQIGRVLDDEPFILSVKSKISSIIHDLCDDDDTKAKLMTLSEDIGGKLHQSDAIKQSLNDLFLGIIKDEIFLEQVGTSLRGAAKHAFYGVFKS